MTAPDPVLVELTRGPVVESRHRGAAIVVDADGERIASWGDVEAPVFPRSAVKPLQALAVVETGAADRFAVTDAELALAAASHGGEPDHVGRVAAWLDRIGLCEDDLACGGHAPLSESAALALACAGVAPGRLHNNCSGKHTAILTSIRHLGEATNGYGDPNHPAQGRLAEILGSMGNVEVSHAPRGVDGCAIPTMGMPLSAVAYAMARMAAPDRLSAARSAAARRVTAAMIAHPNLVGGAGRFDSVIIGAGGGRVIVKGGAEGVHAAALPECGLGIALKISDGARRAAETAMATLLSRFAEPSAPLAALLGEWIDRPITNTAGAVVGCIRPTAVLTE